MLIVLIFTLAGCSDVVSNKTNDGTNDKYNAFMNRETEHKNEVTNTPSITANAVEENTTSESAKVQTTPASVAKTTKTATNTEKTIASKTTSTSNTSKKTTPAKTSTSTSSTTSSSGPGYILNKNSKIFHLPGCGSVAKMKESNKIYSSESRAAVISKGYKPCQKCNP